ncbi:MAG: 16S rRNA (cytosine(1402)-N(4))-methyltransferase RsmH [Marinilabiliales bacterium]|nr:16S rRNA (cytosine(1402)-N(4))-methyltransferase RsmH [Marinilabiliales bacterium]
MSEYHIPVLLQESIDGLHLQPEGIYADVTFGGGGHSRKILERLQGGKLIAFDQDSDAQANLIADDRLIFVRHNFRYLKNFLRFYNIEKVDGILADLGVSSHDFDQPDRGFSFRFDGQLDMRMNRSAEKDAVKVINEYEVARLGLIFREYGEINNWSSLAKSIEQARSAARITTVTAFLQAIDKCVPKKVEKKYLAQVFQALRIEVNNEMEALQRFLEGTLDVLRPGGRLVVISYHSLEDRMVKNFMRSGRVDGKTEADFYGRLHLPFEVITRKVMVPGDEEIAVNPRARSARLRIAERVM